MTLFLLTHEREVAKKTNTGSVVVNVLGEKVKMIIWERVKPNEELLAYINDGSIALLYPKEEYPIGEEGTVLGQLADTDYQNYIIIDSTWQQARKIYNKSLYLKKLPKVSIVTNQPSSFHLRRNQKINGLCTAECVIALLNRLGEISQASELQLGFDRFLLAASS